MFVVEVIPITKGSLKDRLSFFSKVALSPGVVVQAPIRGKETPALVVSSKDAREEKLALRSGGFSLKKLSSEKSSRVYPRGIIDAVIEAAQFYALPEGVVLEHFSPLAVLTAGSATVSVPEEDEKTVTTPDRLVLQAEYEDRIRTYRNITREAFARGQSVAILSPTIPEAESLFEKLSRGIDEQVVLATSSLSKKASLALWKRAIEDPEPLLIIMTHSFLTIPRTNLSTIIVERESARAFIGRERTRLDARTFAEARARHTGARLLLADFPLRVETRARLEAGALEEAARLQVSSRASARARIVDARTKEDPDVPKKRKVFSPLTDYVKNALASQLKREGRSFVYAARLGLAPLTLCNDCETPVTDPVTGVPMTLHKTPEGNVFLSHQTGAVIPSHTTCKACGSWNLVSLGIGAERVEEELRALFPGAHIVALTSTTAPTHAKAKRIAQEFFSSQGTILVGTERALPYLLEPVELSVIASMDSVLSSSAWRAHEYALQTLFYLKDRSQEELIVQTRMPDTAVMKVIASGNPTDFYRDELAQRTQFGYPPEATFIGLTWVGTEHAAETIKETVCARLKEWDLVGPLPARQVGKNSFLMRAVIRLPKGVWPDDALRNTLTTLPPSVAIAVDPDEIV